MPQPSQLTHLTLPPPVLSSASYCPESTSSAPAPPLTCIARQVLAAVHEVAAAYPERVLVFGLDANVYLNPAGEKQQV